MLIIRSCLSIWVFISYYFEKLRWEWDEDKQTGLRRPRQSLQIPERHNNIRLTPFILQMMHIYPLADDVLKGMKVKPEDKADHPACTDVQIPQIGII